MANRFLNNITINDAYTLPSTDGTLGQAIVTDGAGNLTFSTVAAGTADAALKISLTVKNVSGGTLNAGTIVRVAPTPNPPAGNVLEVDIADNSAASTMPAIGILVDSLADQAEGDAIAFGRASGFSTSGYTEGDPIWVGSSGAFVGTKPTGSNLIQKFGQIIKVHATNGSIEVFGAGRTNDVPNLSQGKIWVGTATNTAESTLIDVDETNNILTVNGKIYYGNIFAQESDLPSATTYHGMFAHVHGTGYAYYAHAGAWVKLAKLDDINNSTLTVTAGTGLSGGGTFTTNQSADSAVTVNIADTAVTPGTYGDANNTPQITIDQQGRITTATTVQTAGSGGGGVSSTIYRETFSGDDSTTIFTLSNTIVDEANTQVYIDGVYQSKLNYSTSGTSLTFSTAPPTGTNNIEVVHIAAAAVNSTSGLIQNSFTGDGSTVGFTLSITPTDENFTFVFIQGVYQDKSTYTVSGNTITFSTAPQNGYSIEVMSIGAVNLQQVSYLEYDSFTGNGSTTNYTLLNGSPSDEKFTMVYIQGVYQEKSTYSLSAGDIIFSTAPQSGYTIEIISVNGGGIQAAQSYTPTTAVKANVEVISTNTTAAGHNYLYVFTASLTLTLPASPEVGDSIKISNRSGTTTCVLGRNGNNIMGSASDLTLDTASASFELIYSGATQGWVIIGQ